MNEIKVPSKLSNPDPMIMTAQKSLTKKRTYGLRDGRAYTDLGELNISVTPGNVTRALCFMDALIKCLRNKAHEVCIIENSTCVKIQGEIIKISLREKQKRVVVLNKYNSEESQYHPSGILVFQYYDETWRRTDLAEAKLKIEDMVEVIIVKLETKAEDMKVYQAELEKGWAEQAERRRIEQEKKDKKDKALADVKELLENAERWHKSEMLRKYINSVEERATTSNDASEETRNWLAWARKKADWYDPNVEAEDKLLDEVNRENLSFIT